MTTRTIFVAGLRILGVCLLFAVCFTVSVVLSGLDKIAQQPSVSQPAPYMKLAIWHGRLPQGRSQRLAIRDRNAPTGVWGRMPHCPSPPTPRRLTIGIVARCLSHVQKRTSKNNEIWLEMMWLTLSCGRKPATAAIMKLIDPWQWTTARSEASCGRVCAVCSRTVATARGWSILAP